MSRLWGAVAPPATQLFVVEDDPALQTLLCDDFSGHGLVASGMGSAEEMLARFATAPPDLLLLDVELEGLSGLEACRRVRATGSQVPIVMLSTWAIVILSRPGCWARSAYSGNCA